VAARTPRGVRFEPRKIGCRPPHGKCNRSATGYREKEYPG